MRILAVADHEDPALGEHFRRERWGEIDAIISCGDLKAEYLEYLVSRFDRPLYYVRGNHDIDYSKSGPGGCESIDGRIIRLGDLRVLGLEGSRWYGGKGVELTEQRMAMKIKSAEVRMLLSGKIDILVTHAPPRFCADHRCDKPQGLGRACVVRAGDRCTEAGDLPHAGFETLQSFVLGHRPPFLLHGHTHLSYGMVKRQRLLGDTRVIDCYGAYILDTDAPLIRPAEIASPAD